MNRLNDQDKIRLMSELLEVLKANPELAVEVLNLTNKFIQESIEIAQRKLSNHTRTVLELCIGQIGRHPKDSYNEAILKQAFELYAPTGLSDRESTAVKKAWKIAYPENSSSEE